MKDWLKESYIQKIMAIGILIVALYFLRHVMNLILLTFIFTYLFHTLHTFLQKRIKMDSRAMLMAIYGVFVSLITFIGFKYAPVIAKQVGEILTQISNFHLIEHKETLHPKLYELISHFNIGNIIRESGNHVLSGIADISGFAIQIVIAILLSFFFMLEKEKILLFLTRFKHSKVSFLYTQYKEFGQNFLNTFGKVVQVQLTIASANAALSFIGLWILGFPQLLGLTIMIFFLGLIPVAGVIISLIPLAIIAFQIGGFIKVIHVIVLVIIIHALENYFLNPKLYSLKMKIPIFFTFSILIVSEHLLGVWGLLLGIPLFMFILDIVKANKEDKKEMP